MCHPCQEGHPHANRFTTLPANSKGTSEFEVKEFEVLKYFDRTEQSLILRALGRTGPYNNVRGSKECRHCVMNKKNDKLYSA